MSSKVEAFEAIEQELLNKHLRSLKCAGCGEKSLQNKGATGNARGAVRKSSVWCPKCNKSQMLHLALSANQQEKDADRYRRAFEEAGKESQGRLAPPPATPLSGKPTKRKRVMVATPLGIIDYVENEIESSGVSSGEEYMPELPIDAPGARAKVVPQAEGGPEEEKEQVSMLDRMHAEMLAKDEKIATLEHQMAVQANEIAALKLQLQEILSVAKEEKPAGAPPTPKPRPRTQTSSASPKSDEAKPTAPPAKPSYRDKAAAGAAANNKPKATAQRPKLPAKELAELRRCVAPVRPPPRFEKVCFAWNAPKEGSRAVEFGKVWKVLAAIKVKSHVKEVSFVGRSIVELYIEESKVGVVKDAMANFVRADTVVPAEKIESFQFGKVHGEELRAKVEQRIVVLLARNPQASMQECILRGHDTARHTELKARANMLREQWATDRKKQVPRGDECQ
jgi:hypothetical protein